MNFDRFQEPDDEMAHHERDPDSGRKERCWRCKGSGNMDIIDSSTQVIGAVSCPVCLGTGTIDL